MMNTTDSFKIVYVPADDSRAIEEWAVPLPADTEGQIGCLTAHLRKHFNTVKGTASPEEEKAAFKQQMMKNVPKGAKVTDDMVNFMLNMESLVDSVPLCLNTAKTNFIGVNLYVDDRGSAKALPVNARASGIAQQCKKMLEVRGDAFIGRVVDDNSDRFERLDFTLADLNTDAAWFSASRVINKAEAIEKGCSVTGCTGAGTLRCSRCKKTSYCSAECQKKDWKFHKQFCKK